MALALHKQSLGDRERNRTHRHARKCASQANFKQVLVEHVFNAWAMDKVNFAFRQTVHLYHQLASGHI